MSRQRAFRKKRVAPPILTGKEVKFLKAFVNQVLAD
jgi:hypothetical protein